MTLMRDADISDNRSVNRSNNDIRNLLYDNQTLETAIHTNFEFEKNLFYIFFFFFIFARSLIESCAINHFDTKTGEQRLTIPLYWSEIRA